MYMNSRFVYKIKYWTYLISGDKVKCSLFLISVNNEVYKLPFSHLIRGFKIKTLIFVHLGIIFLSPIALDRYKHAYAEC